MCKKTKVVITSGYRWSYFQWFILGFYELEKMGWGGIELKFKLPLASKILSVANSNFVIRIADKIRRLFENDSYNMSGYIEYIDDAEKLVRKFFTIDSADSPFLFDSRKLNDADVYFKIQCPKYLAKDGFYITDDICIPWLDHAHVNADLKKLTDRGERKRCENFAVNSHKIKPLMLGPRALSPKGFSFKVLKEGYDNYLKDRTIGKTKEIMCYFGNSNGPCAEEAVENCDYDWEPDILGFYKEKVCHPNEKRAVIADYLKNMKGCDGRVITRGNSDTGVKEHRELIVPLKDFCAYVSQFKYNVNVSGYRMSIPNRFIESFMVGTGIITDELFVKWYKSFDEEVFETIPMGYIPMERVDWKKFEYDLNHLPEIDANRVISAFEKKWAPIVVANYIIDTIKDEKEVNNS